MSYQINLVLESCVETLKEAITAEKNGASKIELCENLFLSGLTPDRRLIKEVLSKINIPLKVMIRPRGGDYLYSNSDFEKMISDIRFCREVGVPEIVTGILTKENGLDIHRLKIIGSFATPMKITIHKCIDETNDPLEEIEKLLSVPQVKSILSSGKAKTALEGKALLRKMIKSFQKRLNIIPAGKITRKNLSLVHRELGAKQYHGRKIVGY